MTRRQERLAKFRSSISALIPECDAAISQIDGLQPAIEEIERLKLAASKEAAADTKRPFYDQIDQIRRDSINPVAGNTQQLFKNIESALQLCPHRKDLNTLCGRILSLEYFKEIKASLDTRRPQSYLMVGNIPAIDWHKVRNDVDTCKARLQEMAEATSQKKPKRKKSLNNKEKAIRDAIKEEKKGMQYCTFLKGRGVQTPPAWQKGGCPKEYPDAYKRSKEWRKKIQDEKSRVCTRKLKPRI